MAAVIEITVKNDETVTTAPGDTYTLFIHNSKTVAQLKARVKDLDGVPPERQILFFNGTRLEKDGKALREYDIETGDTVTKRFGALYHRTNVFFSLFRADDELTGAERPPAVRKKSLKVEQHSHCARATPRDRGSRRDAPTSRERVHLESGSGASRETSIAMASATLVPRCVPVPARRRRTEFGSFRPPAD
eukprot:31083-Pelagococcus_subviridis.AAC.28